MPDIEKQRAAKRRYYLKNKEKIIKRTSAWKAANPDRHREMSRRGWRKLAGLPDPSRPCPERCECCGKQSSRTLHLDHCHKTGKFRGWLCSECNLGMGLLGDSLDGVDLAVKYLHAAGGA
jgi:hypothetical protein